MAALGHFWPENQAPRPRKPEITGFWARYSFRKVWTVTVIVQTFLRYSSMSDVFGLAYLVGQIED